MKVSDLVGARKEIFSILEDKSVLEAAQYFREKGVRSAGVVNAAGTLVGVISQSDISDKVAAENKCPAWIKVSDIMTRSNLLTVTPAMTFEESLRLMEQNGVYHLLIVDADKFLGMLSVSDLLRVLVSDHKERADLLESYVFAQR
jgi:CBS domain-containing protein